ncbi:hypothetical protein PTSG_02022 [Salpingoeca rosetta]|uniref:3-hydroxyacyl-CoA dehydrogenase NAD binding domain-containing protein n=1 Tax=Salpingoeca rosetta (strain ATCC 50818 / BSB-021) TaxID=946362 RepID=F2TZM9_SALR5|nr:uncharacterized protein PTSG_02022 [Salpingoeca rosetta]EGD79053.1 hypothetical protein PTSG_02022 [Salpingoeca rosetta]|eukprot:XP_004998009.1 hypothetical protein PTSG_02022 [Salpingoeca rosetta]
MHRATRCLAAVQHVTVLGAGLMGGGIAQVAAATSHKVCLVDVSSDVLDAGLKRIENSLSRVARKKFRDNEEEANEYVAATMVRTAACHGHPMGPFQLLDYVGLDTTSFITHGWARDYPDVELFQPVKSIDEKVERGEMGAKSGKGYYEHK